MVTDTFLLWGEHYISHNANRTVSLEALPNKLLPN